jgi:hypothetical protein
MKFVVITIGVLVVSSLLAQDQPKLYTIKSGETVQGTLKFNDIYQYPEFRTGQVIFKSGKVSWASLNYNTLAGEIQFVSTKGDTASLANEETIRVVAIGPDSFYYSKGCIAIVKDFSTFKIGSQERFKIANREKISTFGMATNTASIDSYLSFGGDGQWYKLAVRENVTLMKERSFFIADRFNHFSPLNKKQVYKMFSRYSNELDQFFKSENINSTHEADVVKLGEFLATLKK